MLTGPPPKFHGTRDILNSDEGSLQADDDVMVFEALKHGSCLPLFCGEDVPSSVEFQWRPGEHQAGLTL